MRIDCEGEWLSSYLDGELESQERALAEQHLAACPDCRSRLVRLQRVTELVAQQLPGAPETLAAYVLAALPDQAPESSSATAWVSAGIAGEIGLALAGAASVILALPRLSHAWGITQKVFAAVWTAGAAQVNTEGLLSTGVAFGVSAVALTLAIYGTRLLTQDGETSV